MPLYFWGSDAFGWLGSGEANRIENAKALTLKIRSVAPHVGSLEERVFVISQDNAKTRRFVDLPATGGVVETANFVFDLSRSRVENTTNPNNARLVVYVAAKTSNTWNLFSRAEDSTGLGSAQTRFGVWAVTVPSRKSSVQNF